MFHSVSATSTQREANGSFPSASLTPHEEQEYQTLAGAALSIPCMGPFLIHYT